MQGDQRNMEAKFHFNRQRCHQVSQKRARGQARAGRAALVIENDGFYYLKVLLAGPLRSGNSVCPLAVRLPCWIERSCTWEPTCVGLRVDALRTAGPVLARSLPACQNS